MQQEFNTRQFRDVLGAFATGVTVITTQGEEHPYGMTCTAFSSVSLDPPLVLVCVGSASQGSAVIQDNGVFAVNILSAEQEPLSRYFASRDRPRGNDMFREISHRRGASRSPILDGCAAWVDCRLVVRHDAGDHVIFIGEVLALGVNPEHPPLIFHGGKYAHLG